MPIGNIDLNMVTKSYLLAVDDLNEADRKAIRNNCDLVLVDNALRQAIVDTEKDLIVRDIFPNNDLGLAATDDFLVAGPGVAGTDLQYINAVVGVDQEWGFYGVGVESANPCISRLRMTLGAASSQIRGAFQLEQLYTRLQPAAYFGETVVFKKQERMRVMIMVRTAFAANGQRLELFGRVVEPIGAVVSAPST